MRRLDRTLLILMAGGICLASSGNIPALRIKKKSISHQNLAPNALHHWNGQQWEQQNQDGRRTHVDPIKVLAILVQFQSDDDIMTTGNGQFMMNVPEEPVFNAPPHDRAYFEFQLQALAHYYQIVSRNQLQIESDVFQDIITLPQEMGDYNPGTTEERTDLGLSELMRDAIQLADAAGASFSDYDVFIVFHAGVGRDFEFGYDPTPKDIPSAFLNQNDLAATLGEDYKDGISVQNGGFAVKEAIILPETQNQEGLEFGLLGTMTRTFGFQLGLPALSDTETGRAGVGRWGMMDQGSGNYWGMIPCEPCAFSKVFMGWETPIEVHNDSNLVIAVSGAADSRKIYKVPINDHEYYLIENRRYDANFDSVTYGHDQNGKEIQFPNSGFLELDEPIGVIVSIDEYDYGLPGSGILIWHIDESVILENLEENRINADRSRKGVDLEEADGAQDIGESYGFLSGGGGSELGVLHDAWYKDNEIHLLANHSKTVAFTPDSYPNSRSNNGGNTHIIIHDFSQSDTIMTFSVTTDLIQKGFPQRFPNHDEFLPPLVGDVDGDGDHEIIVAGSYDFVYAWHHDGAPLFKTTSEATYTTISGEIITYPVPTVPLGVFRNRKIDVLGDWDGDGVDELIISGDRNGEVGIHIFQLIDSDDDGMADREGFIAFDIEDLPTNLLLDVTNKRLAVISFQGYFRLFSSELNQLLSQQLKLSTLIGICQRPENRGWVVTSQDESGDIYFINNQGNIEHHYEMMKKSAALPSACYIEGIGEVVWFNTEDGCYYWNKEIDMIDKLKKKKGVLSYYLPMAVADIDQDGFPEALHATLRGQVYAFNYNGIHTNGFPVPNFEREVTLKQQLIADVNGDGHLELIAPNSDGAIEVYSDDGMPLPDFNLSTGNSSRISIDDLDLDGDMEILAVSSKGMLYVWDLDASYSEESVPWGYDAHDQGRTGLYPKTFMPNPPNLTDWMPKHLAYNYPNPNEENFTIIRYRLEQSADVIIKIYDLSGEKVDAFSGPGMAQADNEVRWDLSDVASGVYICHIQATSESGSTETTFKIGVVK